MPAPPMVAWLAHFPNTNRRFWSGDTDLTFDSNTWEAAAAIQLEEITDQIGSPNKRARASFRVTDPTLRATFLQDIGPEAVSIRWISSADRGISWTELPILFVGRVSTSIINDGVFSCELETYTGSVDKGLPKRWSHENQMTRQSGQIDRFLEMTRMIEAGAEQTISWPP